MMHVKEKLTKMLMYKKGKLIPLELLLNFLVVWKALQVMYESLGPLQSHTSLKCISRSILIFLLILYRKGITFELKNVNTPNKKT